jgi:hypothetical protein
MTMIEQMLGGGREGQCRPAHGAQADRAQRIRDIALAKMPAVGVSSHHARGTSARPSTARIISQKVSIEVAMLKGRGTGR